MVSLDSPARGTSLVDAFFLAMITLLRSNSSPSHQPAATTSIIMVDLFCRFFQNERVFEALKCLLHFLNTAGLARSRKNVLRKTTTTMVMVRSPHIIFMLCE
jgi:hypothetical protein